MVTKLIQALISTVIVAVVFVVTFNGVAQDGGVSKDSMVMLAAVVAVAAFIGSFVASMVGGAGQVPMGEPRRSTGIDIEEDVEDGRERGVVKWFNVKKGFGFITWDEGEDVFVHFRSIRGQGHRSLSEGQRVKFSVVHGEKGPQAEDVSAVR